jgi:tetratricopeptide (TPR) repeat protein
MDKYGQAIKFYQEAIRINPKDSSAYDGLGTVYYLMDRFNESFNAHQEAIRINPRNLYAYYGLGDTCRKQGRYEEAIKYFKEAIKLNPDDSRSYDGLALVYFDICNYDEAIRWYKEAMKRDPKNTNVYYGMGRVYEALGDYGEAEKLQQEAIRINSNEFRSYEGLGNIYRKQNKYHQAGEWYIKSIKKCPPQRFILCPYEGLGLVYSKLGNPRKAEETFREMVELKPYNPLGYYNLARYYYGVGKSKLARENIDKAVTLIASPYDKRRAMELKGLILIKLADYSSAEKIFNGLIKEYGPTCGTLAGLGHIANAREDYKTARRYFEDALKKEDIASPDRAPLESKLSVLLGLALTNANERKYKEAIACYQEILKKEPFEIYALIGLGDVYRQLGEPDKADAYFKRAAAINPEFLAKKDKSTRGTAK